MSVAASSSVVKRHGRNSFAPSMALAARSPPRALVHSAQPPSGMLPLVLCPCCKIRSTICLVSKSEANPGRVFYKCPNHRIDPDPCQHYYWEDGPDNYMDFLVRNGHITPAIGSVYSTVVNGNEETDGKEECGAMKQNNTGFVVIEKKMAELIFLCRIIFIALMFMIAIMVFAVLKI